MFTFLLLLFDVFAAVGSRREEFFLAFPAMGVVIGLWFTLAVLSDAGLTNSGIVIQMSANDWLAVQYFTVAVWLSNAFGCLYRIKLML